MPYPGRPSPPNGPGLYRTPAFILSLAALCGLLPARPSLCSLKALRSMVDGAMMWLFPVGRAHIIQLRHPVLGAPASLIGSGPPGPSGSGLYTVPGRVVSHSTTATRPTQCAPSALRRSVCGETMSTPGALGTRYSYNPPVLVAPASLIKGRSSSPIRLWPFALSRSYAAIIAAPLLGKREQGWGFAARLRPFIVLCPAPMP
jgi:hypothetical protein